jgi:hypothetical protein
MTHINREADRPFCTVFFLNRTNHRINLGLIEIDDSDACSFVGEKKSSRSAHSACRASHNGNFAVQASGKIAQSSHGRSLYVRE